MVFVAVELEWTQTTKLKKAFLVSFRWFGDGGRALVTPSALLDTS